MQNEVYFRLIKYLKYIGYISAPKWLHTRTAIKLVLKNSQEQLYAGKQVFFLYHTEQIIQNETKSDCAFPCPQTKTFRDSWLQLYFQLFLKGTIFLGLRNWQWRYLDTKSRGTAKGENSSLMGHFMKVETSKFPSESERKSHQGYGVKKQNH